MNETAASFIGETDPPEDAEIPSGAEIYWQAFHDLHACRPFGAMGGAGAIPWPVVDAWARRHGVDGAEFEALVTVVTAMDRAFLAWDRERAERERDGNKAR